jgi:hypothetical protein
METVENWSDFLREPTRILPRVESGHDVVLRRRDGENLYLSLKSRADASNLGTEICARLLHEALGQIGEQQKLQALLLVVLEARFPWARLLPPEALTTFMSEFTSTVEACASVGNTAKVAELLADWRATAEVYADPELAKNLKRPLAGNGAAVPRPKAEGSR